MFYSEYFYYYQVRSGGAALDVDHHTNEIMSFRLTSQSAAAVAAILLMPFREYLSADDEQQGKHDDLVVDGICQW